MSIVDAILKAYERHAEHLMEELPDRTPVSLLVSFRLGELRALKRLKSSGGACRDASTFGETTGGVPRPGE